ncbi:putative tRNA (uracil-5-)-methyltransferase [Halenospora varia]|nr:putative tRNA (uracil-5-)-methyltransferase [Halenospora varia]
MLQTSKRIFLTLNRTQLRKHVGTMDFGQSKPQNPQERKRQSQGGRPAKRQRIRKEKPVNEGSHDEVLLADVRALFAAQKLADTAPTSNSKIDTTPATTSETSLSQNGTGEQNGSVEKRSEEETEDPLPTPFTEIEVKVLELSSTGDGLAKHGDSDQIYVVPFTAPGDIVKVKVIRHNEKDHYSLADFVSVVTPGPLRDDSRINCKYFSTCGGCQFQMMDYPTQLAHKRKIVEKAYKNFSQLPLELVPVIKDTIGSPLQYGYRTKLTPHFDGPLVVESVPEIGFIKKGTRQTLDIEDCPIGTDVVRLGMGVERTKVIENLASYSKGATILLRESTERIPNDDPRASETPPNTIKVKSDKHTDLKTCVTDNNGTSTEYIDDFVFTNTAGAFFQNNNSILPVFTQYIRDHIMPPPSETAPKIKNLIDAYSGSGLFTITLASLFDSSTGIDVAASSIISARENARLNNLPPSQCTFIAADANKLFEQVTYPKDETVVVLDPPRKGCDMDFLTQLLDFGPRRVVYVSCNVHTQARDVGVLVRGFPQQGIAYEIESLVGFDFFPQTGHVEGVAVLNRIDVTDPEVHIKRVDKPKAN